MKSPDRRPVEAAERTPAAQRDPSLRPAGDTAPRPAAPPTAQRLNESPRMVAQRERMAAAFGPAVQATSGLPDGLKAGVESLSGLSLDHVKVHYNSSQPAQLSARAYAQGSDIHLAPGQEQHLPHESWHVVQQAQGRVRPTMQMKGGVAVNDDAGLEEEADTMGARALVQPVGSGSNEPAGAGRHRRIVQTRARSHHPVQGVWNFANPNLSTTRQIEPLDHRGIALRFTDADGDQMVVKLTENPPALETMSSTVYREVGDFDVLETTDLTPRIHELAALIPNGAISRGPGWQQVAQQMLQIPLRGLWKNQALAFVVNSLGAAPRPYVQGMPFAAGTETSRLASGVGAHGQRFRTLFTSFPYMVQLGRLAAVDIFLGNGDRVLAGNLGNWFTDDPNTRVATLIDNADMHSRSVWVQGQPAEPALGGNIMAGLDSLSQANVDATAAQIAVNLAQGAQGEGGFAGNVERNQWLDQMNANLGFTNRQFMAEALATGMAAGKQQIVDRLVHGKMEAPGRAVKGASEGQQTANGEDWWDLLKSRAQTLRRL